MEMAPVHRMEGLNRALVFALGAVFGMGLFVADLVFGKLTLWLMAGCW